ncbi:MAG: tRNA (adenosine(37)-N6)-threonylcarbamoyltransferase complex dimerization subunit type 1 TsaB [candidate division Zixibacteria bacterium]|nr:tRNA (adenosine(37)-N6)-threonylcarbamoyltransferase complex dimerization subunit type 1 TsaB [candidate division Zixibacteria bacterium]
MSDKFKNVLSIDTSSKILRLGLQFGSDRYLKLNEPVEKSHGQIFIRKIQDILDSAGMKIEQLDAIIVCTGPGSFTGLRIALSAAKGIAVALNIPIVGISLLDIVNFKLKDDDSDYKLIMPYIRDEYFIVKRENRIFNPDITSTVKINELLNVIKSSPAVAIGLNLENKQIPEISKKFRIIEYDSSDILYLGFEKLSSGYNEDIELLEPLYLKKSQAEINFDKRNK